ncbi:MAG TPA: hypothetical protein VK636_17945, partial [Gemmatimonadaceae bacterium]|nr:hypothetical protein [Gemmatimonadaceae bacterium]
MTSRSSRRIASCVIAGVASVASVATLALSQPVGAQEPRVVIVGGDRAATTLNTLVHISDDSLKALIETHLPDALFDDGDAHHVVLVLDADGRYVDGKVTKATVVTPTADGAGEIRTFVVGDTAMRAGSGPIVIRRRDGEAGVVVGG